jgi:radical SAM protein with 4Fe4S-binding SPASM domain
MAQTTKSETKAGAQKPLSEYTTDGKVRHFSADQSIDEKLTGILGPKFAEYRRRWDAANAFELETDFPLFLHVELSQICNLRCPMCLQGTPETRKKHFTRDQLGWDLYRKIVLEGQTYGCPSISPQGFNEPLLTPDLERYIRFAAEHGFIDIMMNTNGTLLNESRARKLLDAGLTRLRFSLDAATKETYEKIRRGAHYEVTHRNIERFLELKRQGGYALPLVGVNFCKTRLNEHEEALFIHKWEKVVDMVAVQEFIPPDAEMDYSAFYPTQSKLREEICSGFQCVQPWQRVMVRNTGDVCPCYAMCSEDFVLGNIRTETISKLWAGPKMRRLRAIHKAGRYRDDEACLKCVELVSRTPR